MFVKLFVLGRPGCGKSKTAQHVAEFVKSKGWNTYRFKDYDILEKMFLEDTSQVRFRPTEHEGFDVLDSFVFDEVLLLLEKNIYNNIISIEERGFITIEFARENYDKAFKQFSQSFLQDAYFILINTNFETCKQRIHERITHPVTADDHFVSDFALDTYYRNQYLPTDKRIKRRLKVVENQDLWEDCAKEINRIIKKILKTH